MLPLQLLLLVEGLVGGRRAPKVGVALSCSYPPLFPKAVLPTSRKPSLQLLLQLGRWGTSLQVQG